MIFELNELFWKHEKDCKICNQHPQSVASFYYEPMCRIGRAIALANGMFSNAGPPEVTTETYTIQGS